MSRTRKPQEPDVLPNGDQALRPTDELHPDDLRALADLLASRLLAPERCGMSAPEFAERWGYSERTVRSFIDQGLPTVMAGRLRRVDVKFGDRWIQAWREPALREGESLDDIEREARQQARSIAADDDGEE